MRLKESRPVLQKASMGLFGSGDDPEMDEGVSVSVRVDVVVGFAFAFVFVFVAVVVAVVMGG